MKYCVAVTEVNQGYVTVDATDPKRAMEKAEQEYFNGNVGWRKCDMSILSVNPVKVKAKER